jgi:hypothetical protein
MAAEFLPGNPLEGHPRYSLVRLRIRTLTRLHIQTTAPPKNTRSTLLRIPAQLILRIPAQPALQVRHLNRGRHGVVVLAHDKVEDEKVAIKFIVRPAAANKYVEREIINQYKASVTSKVVSLFFFWRKPPPKTCGDTIYVITIFCPQEKRGLDSYFANTINDLFCSCATRMSFVYSMCF